MKVAVRNVHVEQHNKVVITAQLVLDGGISIKFVKQREIKEGRFIKSNFKKIDNE